MKFTKPELKIIHEHLFHALSTLEPSDRKKATQIKKILNKISHTVPEKHHVVD